jgi:transposase-like protein
MPPLVAILAALAVSPQATVPEVLPVEVRAHASRLSREGRFHLDLSLVAREEVPRDYLVRVALDAWADEYTVHDLEPRPAMSRWKPGQEVELGVDLALPADSELGFGKELTILVGLVDPDLGALVPPVFPRSEEEGYSLVERLPMPGFLGEGGLAELEAVREQARTLERGGDAPEAWRVLEEALRRAGDDATKELLRDDLLRVGRFPAGELTPLERDVVASRITGEQIRYWRIVAGRLNDRGMRQGALRLLERTGGALSEQQDRAVLGALGDAERVQSTVDDLRDRIVEEVGEADAATADALAEKHGLTERLMEAARDLAEEGPERLPAAIETLRRLRQADDRDLRGRARELRESYEEAWVAYTPPDQQAEVQAALEHPSFARTEVVASHCFLYIGPRDLVRGIPAESKLRFDLAYVFLTDLFGRKPNPEGDRVTVYFKELFDFGGGIGGGKIIDIGRAEAKPARPVGVDNGLLYHELTHCVDDTNPIFAGFREGLANLGAAYCFEALDQDGDALHGFESNLEQFRRFFLERDLEYWRIQNYGPSAGFFLHFVDTYAGLGRAEHDWSPLRRFFREYRDAPVRDGRERQIVRALGHYLVRAFGPKAFDDLVRFGFPLEERDRNALSLELDAFDAEDFDEFEGGFGDFPTSPLPRDRRGADLARLGGYEDEDSQALRREHGVVDTWMTIGPFFTRGADAKCVPFPPERELDFSAKVPALRNTKDADTRLIWRRPVGTWEGHASNSPVTIDTAGWVHFDYQPYGQRDAAIYAVTSVTLEEDAEVAVHVRADDDVVVFLDGVRLGSYDGRGANGSSENGRWRGPFRNLPDAQRFDAGVAAGRHTLLVKIKNGGGPAGVIVALSRPDGTTLPFTCDLEPPAARPAAPKRSWKRVAQLDARSYRGKTKVVIGRFKAQNKAFAGVDTDGAVPWRRFTVRPGFPKDSPSNLLWLSPKLTRDLTEARVELELVRDGRPPKLMVVLQGEGDDDALSGWSLVVVPHGDDGASLRLERYDRLVYQTEPRTLPTGGETLRLTYELVDGEVSVSFDDEPWMDRVPVRPIPGATGVGLATWGPSPSILSIEVLEPRR